MRRLVVAEHISLDGVIQAPGGPQEDPSDGFAFGGWSAPFGDPAIGDALASLLANPFDLLLGRRTYDIWAPYWPSVPPGNPIGDKFNAVVKHVATHRPQTLTWGPFVPITGDLPMAVSELKASEGPDLLTWGSGDMLQQLFAAGLVDELWLFVYPVILGTGKRLFAGTARATAFAETTSSTTESGVVIQRHIGSTTVRTASIGD